MERHWHIGRGNAGRWIDRAYNVAPTSQVPMVLLNEADPVLVEEGQAAGADLQRAERGSGDEADMAGRDPAQAVPDAGGGLV